MRYLCSLGFVLAILSACEQRERSSQPQEAQLRMKERCAQAGLKARQGWLAKYQGETFSDTPEYGYSERLNTCLYADEYSDSGPGSGASLVGASSRQDRFVLDVFANKILAEYTEHDGRSITTESDAVMCRTEKEFDTRKAELFGR